jgi:hypothetical protein
MDALRQISAALRTGCRASRIARPTKGAVSIRASFCLFNLGLVFNQLLVFSLFE